MRPSWFLLAMCCASACTRSAPTPAPAPMPEEPASRTDSEPRAYPRVFIHFTDHTADEGAWSTTTLHADGTFTSEFEMSDGGSTSTVTQCEGRIEASRAHNWLARLQADATMPREPPVPGIGEAIDRGIEGSYRLQHFEDASTSAWVDPARWDAARLEPLFEQMKAAERCKTFER